MLKKEFTDEELIQFMRKNYHNTTTLDLGVKIGLPASKVYKLAYKLGLRKSPEYMKALLRNGAKSLAESGKAHRYKPGQSPVNKGKKMPKEVYKKVQKTMFKAGHKPHNIAPIGSEVLTKDGYLRVKIAEPNVWELKHRLVWEKLNGQIPNSCNVQFKNGNRTNTEISNLYIIPRNEQINDNSIIRYPSEIRKAIHQLSKLKKTIKQHETN